MKLLKWLSVTDRFYKIYLDKQLAPLWNQQQPIYVFD